MLIILSQHYGLQGHGLPGSSPLGFVAAITVSILFVIFGFRKTAKKFRKQIQELPEQRLKEVNTVKNTSDEIALSSTLCAS
jgi:hypothetical protein